MCGVLHVAYQNPEMLTGSYMVCALFDHYFLLARRKDNGLKFQVIACLYVWDLRIDTLRNGKGELPTAFPAILKI